MLSQKLEMLKLAIFFICVCSCLAAVPRFYKTGKDANPKEEVLFLIELVQRNLQWLDNKLEAVSNPKSKDYGKYVTNDELKQKIGRSDREIASIINWLNKKCKSSCPLSAESFGHNDFIKVTTCVERIECTFEADMVEYRHPSEDVTYLHAKEEHQYKLPLKFKSIIKYVTCLADLPAPVYRYGKKSHLWGDSTQGVDLQPQKIRKIYQADQFNPVAGTDPQLSNAVIEFSNNYFRPEDLANFQSQNGMPSNPISKTVGTNGYTNSSASFLEASLDVEYITTVVKQNTWAYFNGNNLYVYVINLAMQTSGAPLINSVSYGGLEEAFSQSQIDSTNTALQKAGAAGFTWLFATGDSGVGSTSYFGCGQYTPQFPASSPYALGVSGTYWNGQENVWIDTGAGFSNANSRPSYQDKAVTNYLNTAKNLPSSNDYNAKGRAYPDIAAFASYFTIIAGGQSEGVLGTSAATPIVAAMLTQLNAYRHQEGKAAIGFFNPLLYQEQDVGYDVTNGTSIQMYCGNAFDSGVGWDAASGWGAPRMNTLINKFG